MQDANLLNGLSLAYMGDAIYEFKIREYMITETNFTKVDDLHKKVIKYTSGEAQAKVIRYLLDNNLLSAIEESIYKRGRNCHVKSHRKNISLACYLEATGFEALVGFLYLNNEIDRLNEIINISKKISG